MTQRYSRLAARLGIDTHLHSLRHYSATELIAAGVDVRTVAGRLGHGGGGITTLRVYAAWLAESDQRAARGLLARLPSRPPAVAEVPRALTNPRTPRERIAAALHARIVAGEFVAGDHLPGIKALAAEHDVAVSTVHRAFELLREWNVVVGDPHQRPTVLGGCIATVATAHPIPEVPPVGRRRLVEFQLRAAGKVVSAFTAEADPNNAADLGATLRSAVRRAAGPEACPADYELNFIVDRGAVARTFVVAE